MAGDILTPRQFTSSKNLVFSSSKKPQQFETPINSLKDKFQIVIQNKRDNSFVSETL